MADTFSWMRFPQANVTSTTWFRVGASFSRSSVTGRPEDENGEAYRFSSHSMRHTFVFWCLNNGLPTEDVAMLIGDSVQIVGNTTAHGLPDGRS